MDLTKNRMLTFAIEWKAHVDMGVPLTRKAEDLYQQIGEPDCELIFKDFQDQLEKREEQVIKDRDARIKQEEKVRKAIRNGRIGGLRKSWLTHEPEDRPGLLLEWRSKYHLNMRECQRITGWSFKRINEEIEIAQGVLNIW